MDRLELANILKLLAHTIEQLSETEYKEFLSQTITSKHKSNTPSNHSKLISTTASSIQNDKSINRSTDKQDSLDLVIAQLQIMETREQGKELLKKCALTKTDLIKLARSLKIHIQKSDNAETIESKIIEFIVGSKLRSDAFQSVNLKKS